MKVNKEQLEHALVTVKPGLADKEVIEQTTSFAFMEGRVVTYNDRISISHPVPGLDITGAILATNLYKLLGKVTFAEDDKEKEVEIKLIDNELVLSKSNGKMKAGFTIESEIKLPVEEAYSKMGEWKKLPADFNKFLGLAAGSCGKDMSKPKLTFVHVNKEGFIEGADGFRLTKCELKEEIPVDTFLLPAEAVPEVTRLNPTMIAEGQGWIHFQNDEETIISCRIASEEYTYNTNFTEVTGHEIMLPKDITEILDRAGIFAKREHEIEESVRIEIKGKVLRMRASNDLSWLEEEVPINYKEPLSFSITPYLLRQIIKENRVCIISEDKLKFSGDGWFFIAALRE